MPRRNVDNRESNDFELSKIWLPNINIVLHYEYVHYNMLLIIAYEILNANMNVWPNVCSLLVIKWARGLIKIENLILISLLTCGEKMQL